MHHSIYNKILKGIIPEIHLLIKSLQILIQIDQINRYQVDQINNLKMVYPMIKTSENLIIITMIEVRVLMDKCKS